MISKKRKCATSNASNTDCGRAESSRKKLAEDVLADLYRSWEQHGGEVLDRVRTERPEVYFRVLVKLTLVLHRTLGKAKDIDRLRNRQEDEAKDFDRLRNRQEVLQRLEARLADARTLPKQLKAGHEPGRSTRPW
jgi:hypothetical protein